MLALIFIGLLLGIVLGLTGAGGAIFAVPLLILFLSLPVNDAMTLALAAVSASALLGSMLNRRAVKWRAAIVIAFAGMLTAPVGKWLATVIADTWLLIGFSLLSLYIAKNMWLAADKTSRNNSQLNKVSDPVVEMAVNDMMRSEKLSDIKTITLIRGGLSIGLASGLFGVGGGFLIVPFLTRYTNMAMKVAIATSLFAIAMVSFTGFFSHQLLAKHSSIDMQMVVPLISAALVAMLLSKPLSSYLHEGILKKLFASVLVLVTGLMLIKQFI